eukprot:306888_1
MTEFSYWLLMILYFVYNAKRLHKITILTFKDDDFGAISIPTGTKHAYDTVIQSISSLSATRGSSIHHVLVTGHGSFSILLFVAVIHSIDIQIKNIKIDHYLALSTSFGNFLMSNWELIENNKIHIV